MRIAWLSIVGGPVIWGSVAWAVPIAVPNGSFEAPSTFFVTTAMDPWQKAPEPSYWATYPLTGGMSWIQNMGIYANPAVGPPNHIDNVDGKQAAWVWNVPGAGISQELGATYEVGQSYELTAGFKAAVNVRYGSSMLLQLYYVDGGNQVIVGSTRVSDAAGVFPDLPAHQLFVDYSVSIPTVQAGDPWAGKAMGVELLSGLTLADLPTDPNDASTGLAGGYWDVENVRLFSAGPVIWTCGSGAGTKWSTAGNWSGALPSAAGQIAQFDNTGLAATSGLAVDLDGNKTVGGIVLSTSSGGYTLGVNTASSLTLDNGAGVATIQVSAGVHTIAAPVITASDTSVAVSSGASLSMSGGISNGKTLTVSSVGTGSLEVGAITGTGSMVETDGSKVSASRVTQNSLTIGQTGGGAALAITPTGTANSASATTVISSLTISRAAGAWTSQLDLGNNSMVIKGGGAAVRDVVADQIRQGMGLSAVVDASHDGITSSVALGNGTGDTTLGYALASDLQPSGTFVLAGQSVGGDDVLVKYTWKADANLDGIVNVADLGILATNYGLFGKSWATADFNGDGLVNVADLGLLATYYGRGTAPGLPLMSFQDAVAMFPQFGGAGSVPEPASLGVLGVGAVLGLRRKRR